VDIVTQSQQKDLCEFLTDSGKTVEDSSGHSDTESTDGTLWDTDSGMTMEDSSGHSDTEPRGGTVWGIDRQ